MGRYRQEVTVGESPSVIREDDLRDAGYLTFEESNEFLEGLFDPADR